MSDQILPRLSEFFRLSLGSSHRKFMISSTFMLDLWYNVVWIAEWMWRRRRGVSVATWGTSTTHRLSVGERGTVRRGPCGASTMTPRRDPPTPMAPSSSPPSTASTPPDLPRSLHKPLLPSTPCLSTSLTCICCSIWGSHRTRPTRTWWVCSKTVTGRSTRRWFCQWWAATTTSPCRRDLCTPSDTP